MDITPLKTSFSPADHPQYIDLHQKIRNAIEPHNPALIREFLSVPPVQTLKSKFLHREYLSAQFQLLIETMADEYLPPHWRCLCLDNIHKPLLALKRLADCEHSKRQVQLLFHELRVTSHYLQPSLQASSTPV